MKHSLLTLAACAIAFTTLPVLVSAERTCSAASKPNILFILADDLGKEWMPMYGGEDVGMPNLKKLAAEGVVFDNAYVNPQCTPTRVGFLTGQYPFRNGWVNHWDVPRWGHGYFDWEKNPSIARAMRDAGFKTAAAGKWQINDFRLAPDAMNKHGFDDYLMWTGYESGNRPSGKRYWNPYLHSKSGSRTYEGAYSEDLFVDFITQFIDQNKEHPWFVYYPMALPHGPMEPTPSEPDVKGKRAQFEAMVRYTDTLLGRLLSHLDRAGESDQTIVIWLTDNGSAGGITGNRQGRRVRGGKGKTSEAGANVPVIIRAPQISQSYPPGSRCDALIDVTDYFPTFVELAGGEMPAGYQYDGQSFAPLLRGEATDSPRQWIMAMGGGNHAQPTAAGVENKFVFRDRVIRDKRFKLYIGPSQSKPREKLIDLNNDPEEAVNLLDSNDAEVRAAIVKFQTVVDRFPLRDNDPSYRPRAANPWDKEITVESQAWKQ